MFQRHRHIGKVSGNEWNASGSGDSGGECALIAGAWTRPVFVGGWDHSTGGTGYQSGQTNPSTLAVAVTERVFNLQTSSGLFIDMRVPIVDVDWSSHRVSELFFTKNMFPRDFCSRLGFALFNSAIDSSSRQSFDTMSLYELRLFARRHAFAGYSIQSEPSSPPSPLVVTRHHCIDWNYIGFLRPRPNKWRVEMREDGNVWKVS
jgi:hypothetical protein